VRDVTPSDEFGSYQVLNATNLAAVPGLDAGGPVVARPARYTFKL
jgi:hypothetical protein